MSDQDFFFDEDETPAAPAAEKPARPAAPAPARASTGAGTSATPLMEQSVSMMVAGMIGVVCLLAGVLIGVLIPAGATAPSSPASINNSGLGQPAPQLSPDQIDQGLPQGHPDISGVQGGNTTAAPDATTTP